MENSWHQSQPEPSSVESVTAAPKFFAIPELLNMVLVHLPAPDVLIFQRINSTWRYVIMESDTFQEKLFYKCDLVNLGVNINFANIEITPFFLHLQRRLFNATRNNKPDASSLGNLDHPEASWRKMYLSQPAICKIAIRKKAPNSSTPDLLVQIIQHDTIQMNHLRESAPKKRGFVCFSQSDGIRMHHLQERSLSVMDDCITLTNFGSSYTQ